MNNQLAFMRTVNEVFGRGIINSKYSLRTPNLVTGAFNHPQNFGPFISNCSARLARLHKIYAADNEGMKEIKIQLNRVMEKKLWMGAYAELAAYDYMNQDISYQKGFLTNPIKLNVRRPATKTLASNFKNRQEANLDGYIEDCDTYFDVKVLEDITENLLSGIYQESKQKTGEFDFIVMASHPRHLSFKVLKEKRAALLKEFLEQIRSKARSFQSREIQGLSFQISWHGELLTSVGSYLPYEHAENAYVLALEKADKFVRGGPSFLVYVIFPWYNQVVLPFANNNEKFYRAFARRVFCQYRYSDAPFRNLVSEYQGDETIYDVSRYLSGIIFLEDKTIDGNNPDELNVKSFIYLNPNAHNSAKKTLYWDLHQNMIVAEVDDFEHDNY